jgi:hypothetical protein
MSYASSEYKQLAACSKRELERIFVAGETPSIDGIAGFEYRGYNHPRLMSLLRIRKFIKGFFTGTRGEVFGYNTPARQNGLNAAWIALPDDRSPKRFGFFRVAPVDPEGRDNAYLHAILLDYERGGNRLYDVTRVLRDYVVRVEKGSDDLLLGKAYLALGPARLSSNFFLLERYRHLSQSAEGSRP